jgi:GntR family transcriptional regulator
VTGGLDRDSAVPLWAQLVEHLRARAEAGEFAEGVPSEPRLVAEYGVSRHTVREALRRLRATGVVVSRRGLGSWVTTDRFDQPVGALYSLFRTIEATGTPQHSEVRELAVVTDADAAGHLDLPPTAPLVVLRRRRLAGGEPLALDTAWLPAQLARQLLGGDFTRTALYDELAGRCGVRVDGGREEIAPVVPDPATRRQLRIPTGVGAFALHRWTTAGGRPVEWRHTLIRGDRYHFVTSWSPGRSYQVALAPGSTGPDRRPT